MEDQRMLLERSEVHNPTGYCYFLIGDVTYYFVIVVGTAIINILKVIVIVILLLIITSLITTRCT